MGHRADRPLPIDRIDGLPVVEAVEAWCGLATFLVLDDLIAAGDRLIGLPIPIATLGEIDRAIQERSGMRGVVRLREARAEMRPNAYSSRETWARLVLVRAGLPEPEANGRILLRSGRWTKGDLVFRPWMVLLEYEGEQHLTDPAQWATDLTRYNDLTEAGWLVIRVSKRMRPHELVARTRRALRFRGLA
ncbi:hypothetical protein ACLQ2Q_10385 [Microbacterium sp. DT81.1]|uniref:hypothetical protein n=1 Tax=Microbacterium sp. DT81.1 TaxID=3393413 RepID=UPI003CF72472